MEIQNALIKSTMLGYEDHGILTAYLMLDYGHSVQGFGGYSLDAPGPNYTRKASFGLGIFVQGILKTLEIDEWGKLPGKYCRVQIDGGGDRITSSGKIIALGHPLKDVWFNPRTAFMALKD